tara:strand:- start:407 stop:1087 length:681 start_codon:yes stop_codon:yes gene_type:complete
MKYLIFLIISIFITGESSSNNFALPENKEIEFEIIRKNKNIGYHSIIFQEDNNILNVNIDVNIAVKIGFLTIYKYKHKNQEQWKNNQLYKISTNSITNSKKKYLVKGEQKNKFFEFYGVDDLKKTSKNVIPISYWNKELINKKEFLDTQKGILRKFKIKFLGIKNIEFNNNKIRTEKYEIEVLTNHITDEKPFPFLYLWYTEKGELIKLEFNSPEDKSVIKYNRIK